jgi:hypothetical protein
MGRLQQQQAQPIRAYSLRRASLPMPPSAAAAAGGTASPTAAAAAAVIAKQLADVSGGAPGEASGEGSS